MPRAILLRHCQYFDLHLCFVFGACPKWSFSQVGACTFLQRQMHLALASHPRFGAQPVAACNAVFPQLDAEVGHE